MGFSLTDNPTTVLCPKEVREGEVCDRYLAPAISEFVTNTLVKTESGAGMDQQVSDVWRELVSLHQRWGKVKKERKVTTSEHRFAEMLMCHDFSQE